MKPISLQLEEVNKLKEKLELQFSEVRDYIHSDMGYNPTNIKNTAVRVISWFLGIKINYYCSTFDYKYKEYSIGYWKDNNYATFCTKLPDSQVCGYIFKTEHILELFYNKTDIWLNYCNRERYTGSLKEFLELPSDKLLTAYMLYLNKYNYNWQLYNITDEYVQLDNIQFIINTDLIK